MTQEACPSDGGGKQLAEGSQAIILYIHLAQQFPSTYSCILVSVNSSIMSPYTESIFLNLLTSSQLSASRRPVQTSCEVHINSTNESATEQQQNKSVICGPLSDN
jgi:hypothetical protein